jgi:type III pantothenate kinase
MTLFVDIGNSRIKLWLVNEGMVEAVFSHTDEQKILAWLRHHSDIHCIVVASVRSKQATEQLLLSISMPLYKVLFVSYDEALLTSAYANPQQLGIDRWLVTLAAKSIRPHAQPVIIVDAGTAMTIDVLSADGKHTGGYIVPGLNMQVSALGQHTHKVQVQDPQWSSLSIGQNTKECVSHGALAAMVALIKQTKNNLENEQSMPVLLYLTGGDAELIRPFISEATYIKELVLLGLMIAAKYPINQELVKCEG